MFIKPHTTTDLGLIRVIDYPIFKEAKIGATITKQAFKVREHETDTIGFTNIGETPM